MQNIYVGPNFTESRMLILFESTFSWLNKNGERVHPSDNHSKEQAKWALDEFYTAGREMVSLRKLSRALTRKYAPTCEELSDAWSKIAFTNYISGTVGDGWAARPDSKMWAQAKTVFIPELTALGPKRVIVCSHGVSDEIEIPRSIDCPPGYGDRMLRLADSSFTKCWRTPHLSRGGIGWERLSEIIRLARLWQPDPECIKG